MHLTKNIIQIISSILIASCTLFFNSVTIIGDIPSNDCVKIYLKKGRYLILKQVRTEFNFEKPVLILKNDTIKISNNQDYDAQISGETTLIKIHDNTFEILNEFTTPITKEYFIDTKNLDSDKRYVIAKK